MNPDQLVCTHCGESDGSTEVWICTECANAFCAICGRVNVCIRCQGSFCDSCYVTHDKTSCHPLSRGPDTGLKDGAGVACQNAETQGTEPPSHLDLDLRPPIARPRGEHHTRRDIEGIHVSHSLHRVRDITFCLKCGYWCQLKSEKLREACIGVPPNTNTRSGLNRMKKGLHPRRRDMWPDGESAQRHFDVYKVDG